MAQTTPRQYHTRQVHYFRKTVNFGDTGISTGALIGTLPAGAQIVRVLVNVITAFNAVTTNVLTIGSNSTSYNNIVAAGDVDEASAEAFDVLTGLDLEFSSDTDVYAKYTQTGDAATTGQARIIIMYVADNDL